MLLDQSVWACKHDQKCLRIFGRTDRIRTCDPYTPSVVLYQAELPSDELVFKKCWRGPAAHRQMDQSGQ